MTNSTAETRYPLIFNRVKKTVLKNKCQVSLFLSVIPLLSCFYARVNDNSIEMKKDGKVGMSSSRSIRDL